MFQSKGSLKAGFTSFCEAKTPFLRFQTAYFYSDTTAYCCG
ncbi:hypothetical protein GCWU000324_00916 [Kingella oralis ATCC 51147]|uniref:Uncharacterized protein n=1 Tax=Kingella oralis ATCC 51147 TaxID=629741 RepID=C4GFK0_9NEIS|nr:hypothetical protein GCWU000324_00916 [Kingella oralis ATCC 51147]